MPEVSHIVLKEGRLADCLSEMKRDLLPKAMAKNSLAQWVMSFDDLDSQANQRDYPIYHEYLDNHDAQHELYGLLASSILRDIMPLYFASLFHIGRLWQTAIYSLEKIADLEKTENLYISANNLFALMRDLPRDRENLDLSEETSIVLLRRMCEQGNRQYSAQLRLAREWWSEWLNEVQLYRQSMDEFREGFNQRRGINSDDMMSHSLMKMLIYTLQGSSLRNAMQWHGVQLKAEIDPSKIEKQHQWWVLLGLVLSIKYQDSHADVHGQTILEQILSSVNLSQRTEIVLNMLKQKYNKTNPFTKYDAGKSSPKPQLLVLIREHKLPDGSDSPWLQKWKELLDKEPDQTIRLIFPSIYTRQEQTVLIRSADSTIKRYFVEQPYPSFISWDNLIQYIFESNWLQLIAIIAARTNKQASHLLWDLAAFQNFVANVVAGLNKIGYSLKVPASARLSDLLEKASNVEDSDTNLTT